MLFQWFRFCLTQPFPLEDSPTVLGLSRQQNMALWRTSVSTFNVLLNKQQIMLEVIGCRVVGSAFEIIFLGWMVELYEFLGTQRLDNYLGGWKCRKTFIASYDFQCYRMIYFRKTLNVWIIFNHVWLSLLLFWFRQKHQVTVLKKFLSTSDLHATDKLNTGRPFW